jgi:hypothetical protein
MITTKYLLVIMHGCTDQVATIGSRAWAKRLIPDTTSGIGPLKSHTYGADDITMWRLPMYRVGVGPINTESSRGGSVSGARSTVVAAAGISLAVAIGVTGCGAAKQISAKQQVSEALGNFSDAKSAAFTVSLDTTVADIEAIAKAQGDPISASDKKAYAKAITGDIVFKMEAPDGKTFGDAQKNAQSTLPSSNLTSLLNDPAALDAALKKQGSFSASVELSGSSLVDLVSVGGVIYARADVKQILKLAGQDPAELDQALASLPPSMAAVAKAAKGEWVSLDLAKAAKAAKDKGLLDAIPTPAPSASVDPAKVQKLIADLKAAYQQKATITTLGEIDKKGTGYRLGAPAKQVAQAVSGDLIALVGPSSAAEVKKSIAQIPDKTFTVDLWVKDDNLSSVSLDLTQFLTKPVEGKKLAVNIGVDVGGGKVSAPSGATEIDVKSLLSQLPAGGLSGLTGGSPDSSSGSGTSSFGGGLTKAQIKQLKQSGLTDKQIQQLLDAQKSST